MRPPRASPCALAKFSLTMTSAAARERIALPWRTAIVRFLLAWGWFVPALLVCGVFGLHGKGQIAIALVIGVAAWALTAFLDKDRQFLHDRLAGTRLIALPKRAKSA